MIKYTITIEPDGKYCGDCRHRLSQGNAKMQGEYYAFFCCVFMKKLEPTFAWHQSKRLPECLDLGGG